MRRLLLIVLLAACGGDRRAAGDAGVAAPAPAPEPARDDAPKLRALDAARLDDLATVTVAGFTAGPIDRSPTSIVASLAAPPLRALVTIGPCLRCLPADPAAWHELEPELRQMMPGAIEDDPTTRFELAAVEIAGRKCIATWELGAVAYGTDVDAEHAARVYCNDGVTELSVRVDDDAVAAAATVDAARAAAHRDAIESAARTIAAAYLAHLE